MREQRHRNWLLAPRELRSFDAARLSKTQNVQKRKRGDPLRATPFRNLGKWPVSFHPVPPKLYTVAGATFISFVAGHHVCLLEERCTRLKPPWTFNLSLPLIYISAHSYQICSKKSRAISKDGLAYSCLDSSTSESKTSTLPVRCFRVTGP